MNEGEEASKWVEEGSDPQQEYYDANLCLSDVKPHHINTQINTNHCEMHVPKESQHSPTHTRLQEILWTIYCNGDDSDWSYIIIIILIFLFSMDLADKAP